MLYRLCVAEDTDTKDARLDLTKQVREWIAEGWRPLGGVSVSVNVYPSEDRMSEAQWVIMAQAMTKED